MKTVPKVVNLKKALPLYSYSTFSQNPSKEHTEVNVNPLLAFEKVQIKRQSAEVIRGTRKISPNHLKLNFLKLNFCTFLISHFSSCGQNASKLFRAGSLTKRKN